MTIRRATVADAAGIADVQTRTWADAYGPLVGDGAIAAASRDREAHWREILAGETPTWVAVVDDAVAGIMSAAASRDEEANDDVGELWMLYVAPEAQGRGIGTALADVALGELRTLGCREATLWVLEANAAGRRFYERAGWALDGAVKPDGWGPHVRYRTRL